MTDKQKKKLLAAFMESVKLAVQEPTMEHVRILQRAACGVLGVMLGRPATGEEVRGLFNEFREPDPSAN